MKLAITLITLAAAFSVAGCLVTGGIEYTDAKTGATASLGINKEFKPKMRADSKRVIPIE